VGNLANQQGSLALRHLNHLGRVNRWSGCEKRMPVRACSRHVRPEFCALYRVTELRGATRVRRVLEVRRPQYIRDLAASVQRSSIRENKIEGDASVLFRNSIP
jgi:hypothetical protein